MQLLSATPLLAGILFSASVSFASETPAWVGDPTHGAKLYKKQCAACHGDDSMGGRTGISLREASRMNVLRNAVLYDLIKSGKSTKDPAAHKFGKKLSQLEIWDIIAHMGTGFMSLYSFFPESGRYLSGAYTIDKHGLKRIKKATRIKIKDKKANVFTFFDMPDEAGNLTFVPPEPILLDELKKKYKAGYLVFLPFESGSFSGEIGVGMDATGQITKLAVHGSSKSGVKLNKKLAQYTGMGRKGLIKPFKTKRDKKLTKAVFETYLRAMETATMYDRDENERTWADD
jgi:cytochrome c553